MELFFPLFSLFFLDYSSNYLAQSVHQIIKWPKAAENHRRP